MSTVIITGASRGIGRETARLFAENGYNVLINYNWSKQSADELCSSLNSQGFNTDVFKADVSIRHEVNSMVKYCARRFGDVDVLVNNAGISRVSVFGNITETEWDDVISVIGNCETISKT